jgi:PhoH-like ATPase
MTKTFILDTNVLLHDPNALYAFDEHAVVIPIYCIEEIDQFKKDLSELGRNARMVSRYLDEFREKGKLAEGVALPNGGTLRVAYTARTLPQELRTQFHETDNRILAVALDVSEKLQGAQAIFVTKDTNLRLRADALGLRAENYEHDNVHIDELYSGQAEVEVDAALVDDLYSGKEVQLEKNGFNPNQFILLRDRANPSHTALARVSGSEGKIQPIRKTREVWGLRARNKEQAFALDLLLDDTINLVTVVGKAGTGKTLLALAAGLQKTSEERIYQRLLVSRPIFPLGKDIGYLPGDIEEKLNPWMQPIYDNIELLMGLSKQERREGRSYHELIDLGLIEIEPITYIRGRSIPNQYMIVDEAQNLTPHEVKTIITRVGDNTKLVFTGDPYQIDNPYVDSGTNGLTFIVNKFARERIAGHITLSKGERSALAELASNIL